MVESHKAQNVIIEGRTVTSINYNGITLFSFSELGDAFNIVTRDRPIQHQMKILERRGNIKSVPIKGFKRNIRMMSFDGFREVITNAMPNEIEEGYYSKEDAEKVLIAINKYGEKLP